MFTLICDIRIGTTRMTQVHTVKIEKAWSNLADTATVKLPRAQELYKNRFKIGDPVSIRLGYENAQEVREFEGYVKKVKPGIPLEIECEDATYLLRKTTVKCAEEVPTDLKTMVTKVIDWVNEGLEENAKKIVLKESLPEVNLPHCRIPSQTAAAWISGVKKQYGLAVYFRGHDFFIGMAYKPVGDKVKYQMGVNVINHLLSYQTADEVQFKVTAKSILKDNKSFSVEAGDANGESRTLYFYNIKKEETLKERAETEILKYKFTGFKGSLTSFLIPYVEPNMTAQVVHPDYTGFEGSYVVDSVVTTFGVAGARRKVELGVLVGAEKNNEG